MWRKGVMSGVVLAFTASTVLAGHSTWNTINRKLGLGWSDGYHANNGREGNCGWTSVQTAAPVPAQHTEVHVAPAPTSSRGVPTGVRTTQLPQNGPVLPSQKSTPKPAYWHR